MIEEARKLVNVSYHDNIRNTNDNNEQKEVNEKERQKKWKYIACYSGPVRWQYPNT